MKNLPLSSAPRLRRDTWERTIQFVRTQRPDAAFTLIFLETEDFQLAATCDAGGASGHIDGVAYLDDQFAALLFAGQAGFEASLMAAANPADPESLSAAAKQRDELRAFVQQVRIALTV